MQQPPGISFAANLSRDPNTTAAVRAVVETALAQLGARPDFAVVFLSPHHAGRLQEAVRDLAGILQCDALLGCTGESIVSGDQEVEDGPAVSLWLARLPGVRVVPMHLEFERTAEGGVFSGWSDDLPAEWPAGSALILLGEPFSFPADALLERLDDDQRGIPVIGGMASGGYSPGEIKLILGDNVISTGAVAALISGPVRIESVVSQGCRPIGRPYVITKAEKNIILELGGQPPLLVLQELFPTLPERDRELLNRGLHVGRVINEYQERFERGDFLIRNVIGANPDNGAIAIGDYVRPGQTVQFHLRDAQSADEDLVALLQHSAADKCQGALLFTCNGRGTRLFEQPHHDAQAIQQQLGPIPLAGFFAQGELGPIGQKNFMHGFTASVALFRSPTTL